MHADDIPIASAIDVSGRLQCIGTMDMAALGRAVHKARRHLVNVGLWWDDDGMHCPSTCYLSSPLKF